LVRAARRPSPNMLESSVSEFVESLERFAREKPASAALWAFGIGFFLGWKLKPW
jgi:hypothetical protein